MSDAVEVKLIKSMADLMDAGDRENPADTKAVFVELVRGTDNEPRCALIMAGPEGYVLGNLLIKYMQELSEKAALVAAPEPGAA